MGKEDTELTALRKELNDLIEKFKVVFKLGKL